jgi:hypothetical protein
MAHLVQLATSLSLITLQKLLAEDKRSILCGAFQGRTMTSPQRWASVSASVPALLIPALRHNRTLASAANLNAQQQREDRSKNSGRWQIAPGPNCSHASHITAPGASSSIEVRCLAVQPDAALTDQLNDAGSHGGLV